MQKKTLTILGTRPELIKMFTVIKELDGAFNNILIWSGNITIMLWSKKILMMFN